MAADSHVPMSQDIVEVKCTALLRRQAFSHQIEDAEAVLVRTQVDQTRLLQHVGVHTGLNIRFCFILQ